MRFGDFLRNAVLLFSAAATACGIVAIAGARLNEDNLALYVGLGWWLVATLLGAWAGRRSSTLPGFARLLASARTTPLLPELEPGTILFNRLWGLALVTVVGGGLAFLFPQVPAIAAGFMIFFALWWRHQAAAVQAIEDRDGVRFYVERTSPFKPTRLLRTPGFRKNEPTPTDAQPIGAP